jgi:2-polyprenyl-3-methyl-5-hydroxy-6-metoxy-1,4-benzoquinol methylase
MIREEIILSYTEGKDVLDIGSVGQDMNFFSRQLVENAKGHSAKFFLWNLMKEKAKSLTGIDIVPSQNADIIQGDMESHSFGKLFDVAVAGDVLEHVDNQGSFLRNIHRHLKDDGILIITTPNAKWPTVIQKPNPTHTLWHDRFTLDEILKRCGFEIIRLDYYVGNKPHYNLLLKILGARQVLLVVCRKKAA